MDEKPAAPKKQPLTERELGAYLLYRYNAGGYDDQIAAWRESLKQKPAAGRDAGDDK